MLPSVSLGVRSETASVVRPQPHWLLVEGESGAAPTTPSVAPPTMPSVAPSIVPSVVPSTAAIRGDSPSVSPSPALLSLEGAVTSQSSTGLAGTSSRAIDGDAENSWAGGSCTHTHQESDPWWQLLLPETQARLL